MSYTHTSQYIETEYVPGKSLFCDAYSQAYCMRQSNYKSQTICFTLLEELVKNLKSSYGRRNDGIFLWWLLLQGSVAKHTQLSKRALEEILYLLAAYKALGYW